MLQQVLLTTHNLFLLLNHLFLSIQLISVLRLLNFQSFFCDYLALFIRGRALHITRLLDVRIFLRHHLLFLVEHGWWLIWLGEHVKEGRLLLPDFIVLNYPLLPL
jgi:hypothetical protein